MEKQHHQDANKNEDPQYHGIQYSTVRLRNITAKIRRMLLAFESKCYRRIMRVKLTQKITNDTIFSRVDRKETILQKAIRCKNRFGHVARMGDDRKLKIVMFGVMEGKNKRGRPHREWVDGIEDWGKDTLQKLYHLAQERDEWRLENQADTGGLRARHSWCMMMILVSPCS